MAGSDPSIPRRLPIGAEIVPGGVHLRLWAPNHERVTLRLLGPSNRSQSQPLLPESNGYFSALVPAAGAGTRYRFELSDGRSCTDPASRFQPEGPFGPSEVVDPTFPWTDHNWPGPDLDHRVVYELHIGTFTAEGTFAAATAQLPYLKQTGITCLEIMPLADFPGRFGWGYDGVNLFAPVHGYGTPHDLRTLINQAHSLGLAVILDVVYNHFGPAGNDLLEFSRDYLNPKHKNDWGQSINFDGPHAGPVREFFISNARHWIEEYHFDGFRFDATHAIIDDSKPHILAEISQTVRQAAHPRPLYLVAEDDLQRASLVRPIDQGGCGMDAVWNDDFHHSATVALAGRREGYYSSYLGKPQELVSAIKRGYLYQGQFNRFQKRPRGSSTRSLAPHHFAHFLQNHDHVANTPRGFRIHQLCGLADYRALTALLLLAPHTPLLFQGQEYAASQPFHYFADHSPELAEMIRDGRFREIKQFRSLQTTEMTPLLPDPADPETFEQCKLDLAERERPIHRWIYQLHQDLLRLRRDDPTLAHAHTNADLDGAVLSSHAFCFRYFSPTGDDRLLLINLHDDLPLPDTPEPLLAPPEARQWNLLWSSEHPDYGGSGYPPPFMPTGLNLPAHSAGLLQAC